MHAKYVCQMLTTVLFDGPGCRVPNHLLCPTADYDEQLLPPPQVSASAGLQNEIEQCHHSLEREDRRDAQLEMLETAEAAETQRVLVEFIHRAGE